MAAWSEGSLGHMGREGFSWEPWDVFGLGDVTLPWANDPKGAIELPHSLYRNKDTS